MQDEFGLPLSMPMTIAETSVWVVEDHAHLRETLRELLEQEPGIRCSLAAGTCEEALAALEAGQVPHVVLLDLGLPGIHGSEGIRRIHAMSPESRIIVLTVHEDAQEVFDALSAGAVGYLLKPASREGILDALDVVMRGGAPMNAYVARKVIEMLPRGGPAATDYRLTAREREILECLVAEQSQKQIAHTLGLSPHTIDTHLRNIYAKLHVRTRSGAVVKALQERLV